MEPTDSVPTALERAVGGQYRVLRLIGRGGMGEVYLARDEALERLVAIKVLSAERGQDAASLERFRREARTAARLTHPNVVPLLGFGEAEGTPYLVMGYVRGESLAERLRREGRLQVDDARRILAELAEALDHAHRHGVVHRDVKPDNVLIDDESGRALVTDFGVAKGVGGGGTLTQTGAVIGTPEYMSPEQAGGGETDARSDLYSLGALAYAMLAGRPPFLGEGARDLILQQLNREPPPLKELRPDLPDDLAAAVMRCLAKDRSARWPDARSLREAVAPTGLEEEQLPDPLDALDGRGPRLLLLGVVFAELLWYVWITGPQAALLAQFVTAVTGGILLYRVPSLLSVVRLSRRRGFGLRQILGAFVRQPTWWHLLWYPRRFRRPGDVWHRLPLPFRIWRLAVTGLLAVGLAMTPFLTWIVTHPERLQERLWLWAVTILQGLGLVFVFLTLAGLVGLAFCGRHVLAMGLDVYLRRRVASALLSGPTARRSLWKKPEIARTLLPPPAVRSPTVPELPGEFAELLEREAGKLDGASRDDLRRAAAEARALAAEIAALDAEITALQRDTDPEEAARVRQKLASLGPESEAEGEERRQMRRLLAQQEELLGKLAERLEAARGRRAERLEALHGLWRRATSPRSSASDTPTATHA